jgi:acyl-coenzyme A thioesterase PaaI-like protein
VNRDINPDIGAMLKSASDWLKHEHSLFQSLDIKPVLIGKGKSMFSLTLPEEFSDASGNIHGGAVTIVLDSMLGMTVYTALDTLKPIATINLRTDYLEDVKIGARVVCSAQCDKLRDEVAFISGTLTDEATGALLATGSGAFMVGTRGPTKGSRL